MTQEPLPEETSAIVEEPVVTEEPVATEAPPNTEPPPVTESLAEQVAREAHTVPDSTSPSDIVPNRPNIRPPGTEEIVEEAPADPDVEAEEAGEPEAAHESARELIAQAEAAETTEELDDIEAQAEGRVTVLNAVMERRSQLRGR